MDSPTSYSEVAAEMKAVRARALAIAAEASQDSGEPSSGPPSPRLDLNMIGRVQDSSGEQDQTRLELMRFCLPSFVFSYFRL